MRVTGRHAETGESLERRDAQVNAARPAPGTVEVAIATCNGEVYLAEQLDSLFSQTCQDFDLIIADDASTDGTRDIITRYQMSHPNRIKAHLFEDRVGALRNFGRLVDRLSADYALLCDQDDVWLPEKVAILLGRMREAEAREGPDRPILLHSDLMVVDTDLTLIARSAMRYQRIDPRQNGLEKLLLTNVVAGCSMMLNHALYTRARPIPAEASMHDHWLALTASALGTIHYVDRPLVLYRQHPGNAVGASGWRAKPLLRRVRQTLFEDTKKRVLKRFSRQAAILVQRYGPEMRHEPRRAAQTLANLWTTEPLTRFSRLQECGLRLEGFVRNAALFIAVTFARKDAGGR